MCSEIGEIALGHSRNISDDVNMYTHKRRLFGGRRMGCILMMRYSDTKGREHQASQAGVDAAHADARRV